MKLEDAGKMMRRFMLTFKLMPKFIGLPMARRFSPTYPEDEIVPWVNSKKRVSYDFLNSLPKLDMLHNNSLDIFKDVHVPVLLFIGDRSKMSIVSQECAEEVIRLNDRVRLVHLEGASHDIRRTRFDGYLPALQSFLSEMYHS